MCSQIVHATEHIQIHEDEIVDCIDSFDLMYVNGQYQRQYAFLRKADSEVLLVVVNFDDLPVVMDVMIPAHASSAL